MKANLRAIQSLAAFVPVLAALAWGPVHAEIIIHPEGWRFPNIITAMKEAIRVSDRTPLIPGRETMTKGYRKTDGTAFMTYEIEGKIFGVEIDTDGKPPFEYSIMDTDGDGKFESKIIHSPDNKDRAYVPQWVIDYYFSVHPELKGATGDVKAIAPSLVPRKPEGEETEPVVPEEEPPPAEVLERPNP